MKKIFFLFILLLVVSARTNASDIVEIDGICYILVNKNKTAEVTHKTNGKYVGIISIPSTVVYENTVYEISSIEQNAFLDCTELISVEIGNSVKSIGKNAFSGCSKLQHVTIGSSVESIEEWAFNYCINLKEVHITNLETWCNIRLNVYSNPLMYAHHLFYKDQEIKDLIIPHGVTRISSRAFEDCSYITSVTIPNTVTDIEFCSFHNCSSLTFVDIPNSVKRIETSTFSGCRDLMSIIIPDSVTWIANASFKGCSSLQKVIIGNGIERIDEYAFDSCPNLNEVKCKADLVPNTQIYAFDNSLIKYATLYVPHTSIELYKEATPWKDFGTIVGFTDENNDVPQKCALPTINYDNGVLRFESDTDGAKFVYEISDADIQKGYKDEVELSLTYEISVYATKDGYENSDVATATLSWDRLTPQFNDETAKYRLSFIVDNKELSVRNVAYGSQITAPSTDSEGNTVSWYTYPATMPAHDLVVYGMVVKPTPAPAPAKYTLTYMLDGQQYKQETIEEGATVAKETEPSKEGYTFSGWQNEPTTMPAQNTTVTGRFTINSYRLSFIAENRELSSKNVTYGSSITAPTTDGEGNTVSWYTYPATMPAHDLVVYGMVVKQPEPEVLVWLTVKDGQGTTKMKVRKGTEQVLTITPEEGWNVVSVTLDGVDVTAQVKDGSSYTTPTIMSDATLIVVYEQDAPSEVASARAGLATVKVVDDGVVISHVEPQSCCVVYTSSGQQVVSTVIEGDNQKIRLQKGQVYILTINGRTLKFAL